MLVAGLLSGAGCTAGVRGAPAIVQPGAPGEPTRVRGDLDLAGEVPAHAPEDAEFMRRMIGHHQQALAMTALVAERTSDQPITLLARRIDVTQQEEIGIMRRWLERRGEPLPAPGMHTHGDAVAYGMLSEEEMAQLAASRGGAFDTLFLRFMIRHHEGAVQMVRELVASDRGGQESEVFQFASGVAADQPIEIGRMRRMLEAYESR